KRTEIVGPDQHSFDIFDDARIHEGRLVRKLVHVRSEFAALGESVNDLLAAETIAGDSPDLAGQQNEHARGALSDAIDHCAFGVARHSAKAPNSADFSFA